MMLRDDLSRAMKLALKERDQRSLSTIRLILAALKDRDIAARAEGRFDGVADEEILSLLQTMIKQRGESIILFEKGGRDELAAAERAEIAIIQQFLPEQLGGDAFDAAIAAAIAETGACSVKDMGRVMAHLKSAYAGQLDFSAASQRVKSLLLGS